VIDSILATFFVLFACLLAFPFFSYVFGWGRKQ
jgi:hypothetical protein